MSSLHDHQSLSHNTIRFALGVRLCAALLILSASSRALLEWLPFVPYFTFLMWIHVAIIVLGIYGIWTLIKSDSTPSGGLWLFVWRLPLRLKSLALPVAFVIIPFFLSFTGSLGTTPDGLPVNSKSWMLEGGQHYVVLNRTIKIEITDAAYNEGHRELYVAFSSFWILFSYLLLILWFYIWRRENQATHAESPTGSGRT